MTSHYCQRHTTTALKYFQILYEKFQQTKKTEFVDTYPFQVLFVSAAT